MNNSGDFESAEGVIKKKKVLKEKNQKKNMKFDM